jgi:hypothetical protein
MSGAATLTTSQEAAGGNLHACSSTSPPDLRAALRRLMAALGDGRPVQAADVTAVREVCS